jgi:predicted kinase
MSIAIIGIGIPGSGKTTVLKKLAETLPAAYVCPDDIRAEVSGGDPTNHEHEEAVWALARIRALQALEGGEHVILDATFTHTEGRKEFVELLREGGATQIVGAYAEVPLEVAEKRNRDRGRIVPLPILRRKHESLLKAPPTLLEGFDAIVPMTELAASLTPGA